MRRRLTPRLLLTLLMAAMLHTLPATAQDDDDPIGPIQQQIDSLLNLIKPNSPDSVKAFYYNKISEITSSVDTTIKYALLSLDFCKEQDKFLIATNHRFIAWGYWMNDDTKTALPYLLKSTELFNQDSNIYQLEQNYRLLSSFYEELNKPDSIKYYINKALEIDMMLKDTTLISKCYKTLCSIYSKKNFHQEAVQHILKAIELDSLSGDMLEYAFCYFRLGELYSLNYSSSISSNQKAKKYLLKSIRLQDSINSDQYYYIHNKYLAYSSLADVYINLAKATANNKYADSCLYYIKKAVDFFLTQGSTGNAISTGYTYVEYLLFQKQYNEALAFMQRQKKYFKDDAKPSKNRDYYCYLKKIYVHLGDYKNAYKCLEKETEYNDAFINDSTMNSLAEVKTEQAMLIERMDRKNAEDLYNSEKRRMHVIIISLWAGLGLVTIVIGLIIRLLVIKKRANAKLSENNILLAEQKEEIRSQRDHIETQNQQIQSSINYARRIQSALLTPQEAIGSVFPDHFVLYNPRDVVSGDFYWVGQFGDNKVCIVADCTGHGVPGGFMSILGMTNLNYIVGQELQPDIILDKLRNAIIRSLRQNEGINEDITAQVLDGMDVAAYVVNERQMTLTFAGANNPLVLIRDNKVQMLKGDRMPVGIHFRIAPFKCTTIDIKHGDCIYTFSDGYQDQFADGTHNKFTAQRLRDLLLEIHQRPMNEQREVLNRTYEEWRGPAENQTDDVVIMGVRI